MFFFTNTTYTVQFRKHFFPGEFSIHESNQCITVKAKNIQAAMKKVRDSIGPVNVVSIKPASKQQ